MSKVVERKSQRKEMETNVNVLEKVNKIIENMIEEERLKISNLNGFLWNLTSSESSEGEKLKEKMYSTEKSIYVFHSILSITEETIMISEDNNINLVKNLSEYLSVLKEDYIDININIMRQVAMNSPLEKEKKNLMLKYQSNERAIEIHSLIINILDVMN